MHIEISFMWTRHPQSIWEATIKCDMTMFFFMSIQNAITFTYLCENDTMVNKEKMINWWYQVEDSHPLGIFQVYCIDLQSLFWIASCQKNFLWGLLHFISFQTLYYSFMTLQIWYKPPALYDLFSSVTWEILATYILLSNTLFQHILLSGNPISCYSVN